MKSQRPPSFARNIIVAVTTVCLWPVAMDHSIHYGGLVNFGIVPVKIDHPVVSTAVTAPIASRSVASLSSTPRHKRVVVSPIPSVANSKRARWIERSLEKYRRVGGLPNGFQGYFGQKFQDDPIEERFKVDRSLFHNEKAGVSVHSWRNKEIYQLPEDSEAVFYLQVECHDNCIQVQSIRADIYRIGESESIQSLVYRSSSNDGKYMATQPLAELVGRFRVKIEVVLQDGGEIRLTEAFDVSGSGVSYAGKMRDFIDSSGNMKLEFLLDNKRMGHYLLECSIMSADHQLLAKVESLQLLKAGRQWGAIKAHGGYFYNNRLSGPFHISSLAIKKVDAKTLASSGDSYFAVNSSTDTYSWKRFNSTPYVNENIKEKLEMFD
jgi:hypothetical protein